MRNFGPNTEPSLLQSVDFRAFFETLRIRWWVVPAVVAASVGFLQAQDSDLRTNPASYVVSRGYEVASPYRSLQAIGLNLTVVEFPEPTTQLLVLRSNEVQEEISTKIGKEIEVQIPDNWETPVTFTCNQPEKSDCERAIDAYVAKATELPVPDFIPACPGWSIFRLLSQTRLSPTRLRRLMRSPGTLRFRSRSSTVSNNQSGRLSTRFVDLHT